MNGQLQFEYRPRASMLKTNFSSTADFLQNLEHYNVQVVQPKSDTQMSTTILWIKDTTTNSEISSITDITESSTSIDRFIHTLTTQQHQTIIACILLVIFFAIILSYFYRSLIHKKTRRNLTSATETKPHFQSSPTKHGDLDRPTIANLCQFNLQKPSPCSLQQRIQRNSKSFAVISRTTISKNTIMNYIRQEFYDEEIRYLCIGEETNQLHCLKEIYIQIIFKNKIHKSIRFLDKITATCCNYEFTQNLRDWNDYIGRGLNYLEFGEFLSKLRGYKQYLSKKATREQ
ncbi:hypothetical protein I4U23_016568 [Adineta vaga]|nr:hypothetical protein I4U23_016568 [Adineta vaga]